MKKHWIAVMLVILSAGAVFSWSYLRNTKPSDYQTAPVTVGDIAATVAATGSLNAVVTVQVGSQVSGNIKALYADFNTKVTKGQIVALIDPEIFQAKVNQAQANVDNARESVNNARAVAAKTEADIASAVAALENTKAQLAKTQAELRNADLQRERRLALSEKGLTTKEDADNAEAAYEGSLATVQAAQAQVNAAESNVKAAEAQHEVALAQVESTQAQVRQFQAALAQAALDLKHTGIRAPVDGTVVARYMDVGQTVAASFQAPTIFQIAQDLAQMQVDTNVDESDIGQIRLGQHATFTVDAYPASAFPATVKQVRKAAINVQNVVTYDVVLSVDNSQLQLLPGMTANVRIFTDTIKGALKVPNAALRFKVPGSPQGARKEKGLQTIYVFGTGGSPLPVQVTTRLSDGSFTAVSSSNLHAGDLVIVGTTAAPGAVQPSRGPRGPGF